MESAQAKNQALRDAGAVVPTSYEAFEAVIKETFEKLVIFACPLIPCYVGTTLPHHFYKLFLLTFCLGRGWADLSCKGS